VAVNKLSIAIHQHYGRRLHLVWLGTSRLQETALDRMFVWSPELDLCTGVQQALPEGVCKAGRSVSIDFNISVNQIIVKNTKTCYKRVKHYRSSG
jgi:hypothetical protein